ncbi:MAG: PHP domain-containing protein [Treponema sp.]|nr:PHP domain-containing protein [Treponema sp.]
MIDLHTHSTASDGSLSPAALIAEACKKGLIAIALTDHDTLGGLQEAAREARAIGMGFIPGIEININWKGSPSTPAIGPGGEMHLLGLGLNAPSPAFIAAIAELAARRQRRNGEILDRMHELGIEAEWDEVLALSGGGSVGRPHFAALLVKKGIARGVEQAFERFLAPGMPLYAPKEGLDFALAAALIRESGGAPVLAHPTTLRVAWSRLAAILGAMREMGLGGVEAWHPATKPGACRRLEALGKSLGLCVTEGSDWHGDAWHGRKLGHSGKDRRISAALLDGLPFWRPEGSRANSPAP